MCNRLLYLDVLIKDLFKNQFNIYKYLVYSYMYKITE
jgi:hypothetical protein